MLKLKTGTIQAICNNDTSNPLAKQPVVQIVSVKKMDKKSDNELDKFIVNISDSKSYVKARLSNSCSLMASKGEIKMFSMIEVKSYKSFTKSGNTYLYISEILRYEDGSEKIGVPENFNSTMGSLQENSKSENKPKNVENVENSEQNSKRTKIGGNLDNCKIEMVATMNPFLKNFTMELTCINVSSYDNYFSSEMFDKTGKIKVSAYGDTSKEMKALITPGNKYRIQNGSVKIAKSYNSLVSTNKNPVYTMKSSEFEVICEKTTKIEFVEENSKIFFDYATKIADFEEKGDYNLIAAVKTVYPQSEITTKTGKKMFKRDILVADFSTIGNDTKSFLKEPIKVTLWNNFSGFDLEREKIYLFNNLKTNIYNDKLSLGTSYSSSIINNPEGKFYDDVKNLMKEKNFETKRSNFNIKSCIILKEFKSDNFTSSSQKNSQNSTVSESSSSVCPVLATISFIRPSNIFYFACEICRKRVAAENIDPDDISKLKTFCEKCDKTTNSSLKAIMSLGICDYSATCYITSFAENYEKILGHPIEEGYKMFMTEPALFSEKISDATGNVFQFLLSKRLDTYNGENRYKYNVLRLEKPDFNSLNTELILIINSKY